VFAFLDFFQFVGQDLLIAKMGQQKTQHYEKNNPNTTKLFVL
jgi:hypothetical protein